MTSNKNISPLIGGNYYHIYNRGINGQNIFFRVKNYDYFLGLWKKYLVDCAEVLAYCLMPNHFHFVIKIFDHVQINSKTDDYEVIEDENKVGEYVSERLRRLFISYSQALNVQEKRNGSLFTRNFKRIELEEDTHLKYLIFYIHNNAQKHGLIADFRNYRYSSYNAYISGKPTSVSISHGLELFDGLEGFMNFHTYYHEERNNLIFE